MNAGTVKTEWGSWIRMCRPNTPDFLCVVINKQKNLSVIFIETKSAIGKQSKGQKAFKQQYVKHIDVHYWLISDPSGLAHKILDIAFDRLNDIKF
jgi:hypothetical protein